MKRVLGGSVAAAAVVIVMCAPAPAHAATKAPVCGVGKPVKDFDGKLQYLALIGERRNITCATARLVLRSAQKRLTGVGCGPVKRNNGWTIRHDGNRNAISVAFTKGTKRFTFAEQGGC